VTARPDAPARVRPATDADAAFLETMLFEAFFWDPGMTRPPFETFRAQPEVAILLAGWGRPGDRAVVAVASGAPAGAAWYRLWTAATHSYGFVDEATPEIGIAVDGAHRRRGLGRALLRALIAAARADSHPALSLSVSPANPARRLYESEGFRKVGESGTSWTLRLDLSGGAP